MSNEHPSNLLRAQAPALGVLGLGWTGPDRTGQDKTGQDIEVATTDSRLVHGRTVGKRHACRSQ